MATATEMTLTLGRTVYGGDPSEEAQSDERIEGRETRMSVTWRLTEGEQNLPLMASLLAEEAERALGAADRTVRRNSQGGMGSDPRPAQKLPPPASAAPGSPLNRASDNGQPGEIRTNGNGTARHEPFSNGSSHGAAPCESSASTFGSKTSPPGNGSSIPSYSPRYIAPITKAQRLAIQSLCTRHGVADWELRRMVWEQFDKKEQGELNKEQAAELLSVLQQGPLQESPLKESPLKESSLKDRADGPAYVNSGYVN